MKGVAVVALALLLGGCAGHVSHVSRRDMSAELEAAGFAVEPRELDDVTFVDASSGLVLDDEGLAELVGQYAIVFVGEEHDNAAHHLAQRDVVLAVRSEAKGFPVVIGAEMFTRLDQDLISRWEETEFETSEFLERVGWEDGWGMPWELYAPVLELALYEDIALVGLNAPPGISRTVYGGGLDALTDEQRLDLPLPFGPVPEPYREWLMEALSLHMPEPEGSGADHAVWQAAAEQFVTAQRVWDESMAAALFEAFEGFGPEARHVVIAGVGHVRNGWGIESALRRYTDVPVLRIVCVESGGGDDAVDAFVELVESGAADVYCITR